MDWKLILRLSLFGLAMAVATVSLIPPSFEPYCWLAIFVVCAFFIARSRAGKLFLHGFFVSIFNCVWITSAHILFATTYLAHHPGEAEMMNSMPVPPALMMPMTGPVVGVLSGLVLGLFAFVAGKFVKPGSPRAPSVR